jgi:cytochrome c554/c'-like protein
MHRLGYAVANAGDREIVFGTNPLNDILKRYPLPVISANLVYQDSGEPVYAASLTKVLELTRAGGKKLKLRVGILGLARMNPGLSHATPDGRRIVTSDPMAAAAKLVPALRKKCDLVVVLSTLEPDQAHELVQQVPGIDLVLGGFGPGTDNTSYPNGVDQKVSRPVLYAGNQGKRIGEARIYLDADGKLSGINSDIITLGREIPDDPDIMDLVDRNRVAINEIRKKQTPLIDPARLRATFTGAGYLGDKGCKECHEEAYRVWEGSAHAHAFKILEDRHQDYNPECVGCHTTGYRQLTGFLNAKSTADLMNVQCEACHGPGKNHAQKPGEEYGKTNPSTCLSCHTLENSPAFDAFAYRVKIRHWDEKGNAPPGGAPSP